MIRKPLSDISYSIRDFFLRPTRIIRGYKAVNLRPDMIAGLTVAVILLPQAMAYALIAELPPQMGLYTAIVAAVLGALWGSSNHLQTGPTNAGSLLVLSILITVAAPGSQEYIMAAGLLTLMVGVIIILLAIARLGMLVNFVSDSVIIGFASAAGILIFCNQLRHLLRLDIPSEPSFVETIKNLWLKSGEIHFGSLFIGLFVIATIQILNKANPKLPGSLIGIVVASGLVAVFNLEDLGVKIIGDIPSGIPPLIHLRSIDFGLMRGLASGALAIAAIGLVEAMSIARDIAVSSNQRLDSNQEFFGQGIANLICGLFSGYVAAGSFTRSAVNYQAGGNTPISNVFSGLFVLLMIIAFGSYAAYIPLPALAGVVLVVAIRLIKVDEIVRIWRTGRGDRIIMAVTFLATLFLPLHIAVLSGILISLAYYLLLTSTPQVRTVVPDHNYEYLEHKPDLPDCPQLGVIEILGDLYFGAVHHVENIILENRVRNPSQRFLLFRMTGVSHCDISGIHALEGVLRSYREAGGDIFISRYRSPVLSIMHDTGFLERLGEDHHFDRDQNAIGYLFHRILDPAMCIYECPHRVFYECQNLPKRLDLAGDHLYTQITKDTVEYIRAEELWKLLHEQRAPVIIDVREPREFKRGFIPGARSIPLPSLLSEPDQLPDQVSVVLVCRGGRRSTRAASMLHDHGHDRLQVLEGGMLAWEAQKLLEAVDKS